MPHKKNVCFSFLTKNINIMSSEQEAKLSMYLKVQQFIAENIIVLTALFSIITTYKTTLDALILAIFEADALATADTKGYTEAKNDKREQITKLALRISGGGASYYKSIGDAGSRQAIYVTETELRRAKDTTIYTLVMQIWTLANAVSASLAPHGITAGDITNLHLFAQQYLALVELPRRKVSAKSAQGKKVDTLMAETDEFLYETLDPQMRVLDGTDDQVLYDEYRGNRGIDNNPTGGAGELVQIPLPQGAIAEIDAELLPQVGGSAIVKNTGPLGCILALYYAATNNQAYAGIGFQLTSGQEETIDANDPGPVQPYLLVQNISGVDGGLDFTSLT
jgi:hypothetical protein